MEFKLHSEFKPTGDQPQAIDGYSLINFYYPFFYFSNSAAIISYKALKRIKLL